MLLPNAIIILRDYIWVEQEDNGHQSVMPNCVESSFCFRQRRFLVVPISGTR